MVVLHPGAGFMELHFPSFEFIRSIKEGNRSPFATYGTVSVYLNIAFGLSEPYSPVRWMYFFNGSITGKKQAVYPHRSCFIKIWRVVPVVIKQVPLIFKLNNRMMIGPASGGRLI